VRDVDGAADERRSRDLAKVLVEEALRPATGRNEGDGAQRVLLGTMS
jgi:hypothetical protein